MHTCYCITIALSKGEKMREMVIGVVAGDPSGVGPEVTAKLLERRKDAAASIRVFASEEVFHSGLAVAGLAALSGSADFQLVPTQDFAGYVPGKASAEGGATTLAALEAAAAAVRDGTVDAVVYAPLNKQALWLAGHTDIDELHFFRSRLGVSGFCCELNSQGKLWTARVTSHIPLREVADAITVESVLAAARLGAEAVRKVKGAEPRIAIAGLNPHLGEGGAMGREEIDVLVPAIDILRAEGFDVAGLYPADTIFLQVAEKNIDMVVTMFHDQGQIALKAMGFGQTSTVMGGMPIPIVTASQGTAYDIAGRNLADPSGLLAAFDLAVHLGRANLHGEGL
jgi:4-hydroxy-L-threonine phosphate dehydrogenase PdxA